MPTHFCQNQLLYVRGITKLNRNFCNLLGTVNVQINHENFNVISASLLDLGNH